MQISVEIVVIGLHGDASDKSISAEREQQHIAPEYFLSVDFTFTSSLEWMLE